MKKNIVCSAVFALFLGHSTLIAQNQSDSSKQPLLASVDKTATPAFIIKKSNVIFPEVLKGNEDATLPYIEKFCSNRRDYLIRMYTKGKTFLPKAETILKKYALPSELKVLLALESAYNANAVSRAGAVGYWQFMDEVAGEYGLRYVVQMSEAEKKRIARLKVRKGDKRHKVVVKIHDDRRNFMVATNAAARYLRDRCRNLDSNLLLVVASYNCGVGNVWNAMKRSDKAEPTFWDIKDFLPAETRAYVMNFITLNVIFNNYELFTKNQLSFADEKVLLPEEIDKAMAAPSSDY